MSVHATKSDRRRAAVAVIACAGVLAGCRGPINPAEVDDPAFEAIYAAFADSVQEARDTGHWQSGWTGNLGVNLLGGQRMGLCWEWRDWVYARVEPVASAHGWETAGVFINRNSMSEHNAVAVYDPARVQDAQAAIDAGTSTEGPASHVYVLDAWRRGKPDVYLLRDWAKKPLIVWNPVGLEEPPFPFGER